MEEGILFLLLIWSKELLKKFPIFPLEVVLLLNLWKVINFLESNIYLIEMMLEIYSKII